MAKISFRLPDYLREQIEDALVDSTYNGISELCRDLLRQWVQRNRARGGV